MIPAHVLETFERIRRALRRRGQKAIEYFASVDEDGDRRVDPTELGHKLAKLLGHGSDTSAQELKEVFAAFDMNRDGSIDFQEFVHTLKDTDERRQQRITKRLAAVSDGDGGGGAASDDDDEEGSDDDDDRSSDGGGSEGSDGHRNFADARRKEQATRARHLRMSRLFTADGWHERCPLRTLSPNAERSRER